MERADQRESEFVCRRAQPGRQHHRDALGTLKVGGNLTSSTIDITQAFGVSGKALNSFTVNGAVSGLTLIAQTSMNSITVGSISGSTIFAGVSTGTTLPAAPGDFANNASIGSVTVRSKAPAGFASTNIAARQLGKLALGSIQTANGGVAFGIAANTIASLTASDTENHKIKLAGITPTTVAAKLTALGFSLGDFQVRSV